MSGGGSEGRRVGIYNSARFYHGEEKKEEEKRESDLGIYIVMRNRHAVTSGYFTLHLIGVLNRGINY